MGHTKNKQEHFVNSNLPDPTESCLGIHFLQLHLQLCRLSKFRFPWEYLRATYLVQESVVTPLGERIRRNSRTPLQWLILSLTTYILKVTDYFTNLLPTGASTTRYDMSSIIPYYYTWTLLATAFSDIQLCRIHNSLSAKQPKTFIAVVIFRKSFLK